MATVTVTTSNFQETIDKDGIVLIDYWAEWCGPCRTFGPIFEKASEDHPDIVFGKVDTEAEGELAAAFHIRSIPTLMVFRDKVLIFAQPGMLPAPVLEDLIAKVKELDMDEVRQKIAEEDAKPGHKHEHCHDGPCQHHHSGPEDEN
jgi:thioredoxin 1